jgi:hypothetical protein
LRAEPKTSLSEEEFIMLKRTRRNGSKLVLLSVLALAASLAAVGCLRDNPTVPQNAGLSGNQGLNYEGLEPGTMPSSVAPTVSKPTVPQLAISPVVTETGQVSLSLDAAGTNDPVATIQVETPGPLAATVRKAYFMAASTGATNHQILDGDVTIDGVGVNWDASVPSTIFSYNYWADVTAMVQGKINAAAPGSTVDFDVAEVNSAFVDGEILAVIFDDPNQTTDNTVFLLFGAQDIAGDNFNITLADPIDLSDPDLVLDMSLGISYGYQTPVTTNQFSLVDVNGQRLTSSAGGQDDGAGYNGGLITVGGLGDSNANPAPFAPPADFNDPDDELYDLIPFVNNGDTQIDVATVNPSNDDNIFFGAFFLTVKASIGLVVPMDIKPTSCPNPFNIKLIDEPENAKSNKGGILPVALLGTEFLDVNDIDPASLLLEGVAPVRYAYEDVTTPVEGDDCECTTLGADGYTDLTLKFQVRDISAVIAGAAPGSVLELKLTGQLLDGTPFETTDCVWILHEKNFTK